ncbi:MAG: glycosyltransferase [bacterium]
MKNLSIIIPAHNEENRIDETLKSYTEYYKNSDIQNYEILVILNGCTDNTEAVVKKYIQSDLKTRYLVYPEAIGKGGAIMRGFENSRFDNIAYVDADNSIRPEILNKLFDKMIEKKVDCIAGSRWLKGAIVKKQPIIRRITSRVFNLIVNIYFQLNIKDTQCGAKIITRKVMNSILFQLSIMNMAFDVNLLVEVKNKGFTILEYPIEWEDKPHSKVKLSRSSFAMFKAITQLKFTNN